MSLLPHAGRHVWSQAAPLMVEMGDYVTAADLLTNALAHARAHEDAGCEAECLLAYARLEMACARPREALAMLVAAQSVAADIDTIKRVILAYTECAAQLPVDATGAVLGWQHAKAGLQSGIELIGRLALEGQQAREAAAQGHPLMSPTARQSLSGAADCPPKRAAAELMLALARILYRELGGGGYGGLLGPILREREEALPDTAGGARGSSGKDLGPLQNPELFRERLAEATAVSQEAVGLLREVGGGLLYLEACLLAADILLVNPPAVEALNSSPTKQRGQGKGRHGEEDAGPIDTPGAQLATSQAQGVGQGGGEEERLADAQQLLQLAECEALRLCGMALPNGPLLNAAASLPVTRLMCALKIKLASVELRLGRTAPPPSLELEVSKPVFPTMDGDADASSSGAVAVARFLDMFADLAPAGRLLHEEIAVLQVSAARGWAVVPRQRVAVACVAGASMLRAYLAREELSVWDPASGGEKPGTLPPGTSWPPRSVPLVQQAIEELRSAINEALSLAEYDVAEAAAFELANFYGPRAPDACAEALFLWQACVARRRLLAMFVEGAGAGAEEVRLIRQLDALRSSWVCDPASYERPRKALEQLRSSSEAWSLLEVPAESLGAGGPAEGCLPPGGVAATIQLSPDGDALYCAFVRVPPPPSPAAAEPVKGGGKNKDAAPPPAVPAEVEPTTRRIVRRVPVDRSKLDRLLAVCDAFHRASEKGLALGGGSGIDARPPSKQGSTAVGSRLASGMHTPATRDPMPMKLPNGAGVEPPSLKRLTPRGASNNNPINNDGNAASNTANYAGNNRDGDSASPSPRRLSAASGVRPGASRGGASYGSVDIDARGLAECWGDLTSVMEEVFAPLAASWREILAPFPFRTEPPSTAAPATSRSNGGADVSVHLFVDRQLSRLPLEALGVLRSPGVASVARDFSFQVFHNRVASALAAGAADGGAALGGKKAAAPAGGKGGKGASAGPVEPGLSCSLSEVSYLIDVRHEDSGAMLAKRGAATGGGVAEPAQSLSEIFTEEFLEEPIGESWTGLDGAKSIPGEGDLTRLLASAKTFVYFGLGRMLAYVPPRSVVPLHLRGLALALLVDRVNNEESLRAQAFADNRKSPRLRALEGAYETAALLSLRGAKTVVLNGMSSTVDSNHTAVCKIVTGIKSGNTVARAVRSCTQLPPPEGEKPVQWQPHDFTRYTLQVYGIGQMRAQA